jgi:SAM-dependent methyltransferase
MRGMGTIRQMSRKNLFRFYISIHRALHRVGVLPYSRNFGYERGMPVGRYYVERFLRENADLVCGRCLEFGEPNYRGLFPNAERYEVLSIIPGPKVDYLGDIHELGPDVPRGVFDAIICTQVFEHLSWPEKAAASIRELLRPGGLLLLTAPFINPVHYVPTDFRRFTPESLRLILEDAGLVVESVDFGGNSLVSTGSLLGMVVEDFSQAEVDLKDPVYPYNVVVRARRRAE